MVELACMLCPGVSKTLNKSRITTGLNSPLTKAQPPQPEVRLPCGVQGCPLNGAARNLDQEKQDHPTGKKSGILAPQAEIFATAKVTLLLPWGMQ